MSTNVSVFRLKMRQTRW